MLHISGMRFHALVCDYDGTLAREGVASEAAVEGLKRLRASGRKLVLATGRELPDLLHVFPGLGIFDIVVAENGALVYVPATKEETVLHEAPEAAFVTVLKDRGVSPLSVGRVIVATRSPHENAVLAAIHEMGLELQVIFNKGAVMVLPSGVNKASGLARALDALGLSPHNAVAVGDAENDHALLAACECGVAVANALPWLKERADFVTRGVAGAGVLELAEALMATDLAELAPQLARHEIAIGVLDDDRELRLPHGGNVLLAGTSGSGKSSLVTAILEGFSAARYQFCIIDPEGDYGELPDAVVLGNAERAPTHAEVLDLLSKVDQNAVVNLLGVPLDDRPRFFEALFPHLRELRGRLGRPHWIVVDETHHMLPKDAGATLGAAHEIHGLILVTVHPEHLAPALVGAVDLMVALGKTPAKTVEEFGRAIGKAPPAPPGGLSDGPLEAGRALAWWARGDGAPFPFQTAAAKTDRRRHSKKYAKGELPPERSFFFRGPEGKLNLRAQNLMTFLQMADGVDDDTWRHHLALGEYSDWFRRVIKDPGLADAAKEVERAAMDPVESRRRIRELVEERYTAPA